MATNVLETLLHRSLPPASAAWLEAALASARAGDVGRSFPFAGRKLGGGPVAASEGARKDLAAAGLAWIGADAPAGEVGRMILLAAATAAAADPVGLVEEFYRVGDNAEKRAVLRALPLAAEPARHVDVALMACRTSVQTVFEAICCENPFPAEHFSEAAFNQMVLKAFFTGVAVGRIVGLDWRKNADLARMAADYASERRAAGRSIPADIDRVI